MDQRELDAQREIEELRQMAPPGMRVNGRAGCNSYGGKAEINGAQLKISLLISTKMACMAPGVMETKRDRSGAIPSSAAFQAVLVLHPSFLAIRS